MGAPGDTPGDAECARSPLLGVDNNGVSEASRPSSAVFDRIDLLRIECRCEISLITQSSGHRKKTIQFTKEVVFGWIPLIQSCVDIVAVVDFLEGHVCLINLRNRLKKPTQQNGEVLRWWWYGHRQRFDRRNGGPYRSRAIFSHIPSTFCFTSLAPLCRRAIKQKKTNKWTRESRNCSLGNSELDCALLERLKARRTENEMKRTENWKQVDPCGIATQRFLVKKTFIILLLDVEYLSNELDQPTIKAEKISSGSSSSSISWFKPRDLMWCSKVWRRKTSHGGISLYWVKVFAPSVRQGRRVQLIEPFNRRWNVLIVIPLRNEWILAGNQSSVGTFDALQTGFDGRKGWGGGRLSIAGRMRSAPTDGRVSTCARQKETASGARIHRLPRFRMWTLDHGDPGEPSVHFTLRTMGTHIFSYWSIL